MPPTINTDKFLSQLGKKYEPGIITDIVLAAFDLERKGKRLISLSGGSYDPASFLIKEIKAILQDAEDASWREILQYGSNRGYWRLREALSEFMKPRSIKADSDKEVLITTGSQQALDLISRVLVDHLDIVGVGSPTYLEALSIFKQFSPKFLVIPVNETSLDIDFLQHHLRELKQKGRSMKILYTVPSFENPTGAVMPDANRKELLELAGEYDFLIVEDNPYGYLAFEQKPPIPIKTLDKEGRIIYLSTFSKIVSPGLRIGWAVCEERISAKLGHAKSSVDLCSDGLSQYVASQLLAKGLVEKQISHITSVYRQKRDLMLESMDSYFPKEAQWNRPKGGIFLWVTLPKTIDATKMVFEAVERGVAYIPGSNFFTDPKKTNYLRLNYSYPSKDDIIEGIKILGRLLKEKL